MEAKELLEVLEVASRLKKNVRHCWIEEDRRESVADHSWRIALLAMLVSKEDDFKDIDMDRVIRMCLIHDLGEAFTGDIPTFLKSGSDADKEDDIFLRWVEGFSSPQREEWLSLLNEMIELKTKEALVYKTLDKFEALISHNESDIKTWLPLEYDLQLTYGQELRGNIPYLDKLRDLIDEWTKKKIEEEKKD